MPRTVTARPQAFLSPHHPLLHSGIVEVTGEITIDLGIGHNNFVVAPCVVGGVTEIGINNGVAWTYGTRLGTFVITLTDDGSLSSAAGTVSFIAIAGSSIE